MKSIKGFKGPKRGLKLTDRIGALDKSVKLKRIETYADTIREVFAEYNTDNDKKSMLFRLPRQPVEGTTTRRSHSENVANIAEEIANNFKWLNTEITRIIAEQHDIGHTPLGHTGEWYLSAIAKEYRLPLFCHNAEGAIKLEFRENIYAEIEKRIKAKNPSISPKKLAKIKRDLWLIFDGINCHNGEREDHSYFPDFSKRKRRFYNEMMGCRVKERFDRTLIPATAEGCLMRLCDTISYIPFDMVDIFRNDCYVDKLKIIENGKERTIDFRKKYIEILESIGMLDAEGRFNELVNLKNNKEYDNKTKNKKYDDFAKEIQSYFINDVIKNTKRNNIRMSNDMAQKMYELRKLNNELMVDYVVLKEDKDVYPNAMEKLMNKYAKALISKKIINTKCIHKSSIISKDKNEVVNRFSKKYKEDPVMSGFVDFVSKINAKDFEFTVESCQKSYEENVERELDLAISVFTEKKSMADLKNELRSDFKNEQQFNRILQYKKYFDASFKMAYDKKIFKENSRNPLNNFKKRIWLKKTRARIKQKELSNIPLADMVAKNIGAQYIGSINDEQFLKLIKDAKLITEEQAKSLTRPYSSFDFRAEAAQNTAWLDTKEKNKKNQTKKATKKGKKPKISGRSER